MFKMPTARASEMGWVETTAIWLLHLPARPGRIEFLLDPLSVLVKAVLVQDQFRRPALAVGYKSDLGVDNL